MVKNELVAAKEKEKLDILLINPSLDFERDLADLDKLRVDNSVPRQHSPFIGIAYLLAVAKKSGLKARFLDMVSYGISIKEILDYVRETRPKLVGFRAFTIQIKAATSIAEEIKKYFPHILICIGGPHATAMPKESLEEFNSFDFVICGEAEKTLPRVIDNIEKGLPLSSIKGVVTRGKSDFSWDVVRDLDSLPFPAWEEFKLDKYPGADPHCTRLELPISTSRGCPFSCIFCFRTFGRRRRSRSIDSVIQEIEYNIENFGCEAIYFCDETFTANLKWNIELFKKIISKGIHRRIKWSCETRVDTASYELFSLMKEAGCYYVFFGFESADDNILKMARKGFKSSQIKRAVEWAKDAGLICAGSFIIGLPGETEESVNKSITLAKELDIYSTTFPIAAPFPGTALRAMAERGGYGLRILTNNWDDYGKQYPGVMESEQLGIDRLRSLQQKAYECNPKKMLPIGI